MNNLLKYISFTKNETRIILFVITVLATGFSIKYYKQVLNGNSDIPYDFSKSDSEFTEKSNNRNKIKISAGDYDTSGTNEKDLIRNLEAYEDSISKYNNPVKQNNFSGLTQDNLNINTATKSELVELPGVGEAIAERILKYRNEKKGFKNKEDLMKVQGIGKKKFEKIKEYIKAE